MSRPLSALSMSLLLAVWAACLCLLPLRAAAFHPIQGLQVYASQDCTGALFANDTTWQQLGSLNNDQMQVGSGIAIVSQSPCATSNLPAGVASGKFSCGVTASANQSVLAANEWTSNSACSGVYNAQYYLTQYDPTKPCYVGQFIQGTTTSYISATFTCATSGASLSAAASLLSAALLAAVALAMTTMA